MKPDEMILPISTPLVARRGEGVLLVVQNNVEKTITISSMNETIESLLGYGKGEILNRRLETILGKREAEALADDLEYDDHAPDFGDIFSRIREVRLRRRLGDEIRVNCTISRLMSQGTNACFQMVIPNEQDRIATDKLNEFVNLSLDGMKELDAATGLPNHATAKKFLPLLKNYFSDGHTSVVFALMRIDRYEKSYARYGASACTQLLMHAYHCCRTTFRSKDLIFALSDHTLGLLLFDISPESTRVVLNRLRWKIRGQRFQFGGKADFSISTSIGFDLLDLENTEAVFDRCEKAMTALDVNERNALIELADA